MSSSAALPPSTSDAIARFIESLLPFGGPPPPIGVIIPPDEFARRAQLSYFSRQADGTELLTPASRLVFGMYWRLRYGSDLHGQTATTEMMNLLIIWLIAQPPTIEWSPLWMLYMVLSEVIPRLRIANATNQEVHRVSMVHDLGKLVGFLLETPPSELRAEVNRLQAEHAAVREMYCAGFKNREREAPAADDKAPMPERVADTLATHSAGAKKQKRDANDSDDEAPAPKRRRTSRHSVFSPAP